MLRIVSNKWLNRAKISSLVLMIFAFATLGASAQTQQNCPLNITGVNGDLSNFTVTNLDTATLSVSIPGGTVGVWGAVVVGAAVNATVNIGPIPVGTKNAVLISASKINANQAASFTLTANDSVGHIITIAATVDCPNTPVTGCTLTQGYWKTHPTEWPVQSLTLGTVSYTKTQLISILKRPVQGNGLISLSYQLIAAKLNIVSGASAPASVLAAIAAADALIGGLIVPPVGVGSLSTASTSSMTSVLDSYNNGRTAGGPPHCDD